MSKLSRFKKPPVVKLPLAKNKSNPTPSSQNLILRKEPVDIDSDDVFQSPPRFLEPITPPPAKKAQSKAKPQIRNVRASSKTKNEETGSSSDSSQCSSNSSTSDYFPVSKRNQPKNDTQESKSSICKPRVFNTKPMPKSCKIKLPLPPKKEKDKARNEELDQEIDKEAIDLKEEVKPKAVCPFCWKKLSDPLAGTVHVKSCAKNIPTNQIFDALQLQEKQIKEWEELGIAYPGFQGQSNSGGTGNNRRGGTSRNANGNPKATRVRKKCKDPELELAIALSESLHEEVERRKEKENEFIVSNDLQNEIELLPSAPIAPKKQEIIQVPLLSKKRGKKVNLKELPLYKASENEKKSDVEKRLNLILDECENPNKANDYGYNVSDAVKTKSLGVPEGLKGFLNEDNHLWNLSTGSFAKDNSVFVTHDVAEIKMLYCNKVNPLKIEKECTILNAESVADSNKWKKSSPSSISSTSSTGTHNRVTSTGTSTSSLSAHHIIPSTKINADKQLNADLVQKHSTTSKDEAILQKTWTPIQQQVLDDILKMFVNKDNPDLTAYGREERPIKCHKFIIKARCPKLYSEIVTETNSKGVKREVISLTCFSHLAVKAFIKFLYCGRLKADLPEKVIEEIEEVGKIYGLVVIDNKNSSATEKESNQMKIRKDEPKSQSKPLGLNDSRIIFEEPPKKNDCIQNLSSRRQSVDMFGDDDDIHFLQISTDSKNIGAGDASKSPETNKAGNSLQQDENQDPIDAEVCSNDGSVDLFEDDELDNPVSANQTNMSLFQPSQPFSLNDIVENENDEEIDRKLEKELGSQGCSQYIASAIPLYSHKRSRSRSPVIFSDSRLYTASQMAEYIDFSPDDLKHRSQAIKKHKLDFDDTLDNVQNRGFNDIDQSNSKVFNTFNGDDEMLDINDDFNNYNLNFSASSFNKSIDISHRQSVLTPSNLQPSASPVQNAFDDLNDSIDPFASDGDSCFINMPSILLQGGPRTPQVQPLKSSNIPINIMSPVSEQVISRSKPVKNILNDHDPQSNTNKSKKKSQKKQRRRALSQEATPSKSSRDNVPKTLGPNGLDYSTVDTPILKKELKRFGLKPLPRSKAKLILRHIIEETAKNSN